MTQLVLSDATQDFSQFTQQFEAYLSQNPTWVGTLTTQTSQTLIELVAAVGTFMQGSLTRAYENAFAETAQSDDAIRSITQMQGLRMSRKLPAAISVQLTATMHLTLNPMTQFTVGGQYYFNREQLTFEGTPLVAELYEGKVQTFAMNGRGGSHQTFLSAEDAFSVSDHDVRTFVNGTELPKSFGTLWNYEGLPAFADLTTSDGRLLVLFGATKFGTVPVQTDTVVVQYVITRGADGSNVTLVNKPVAVTGVPEVTGVVTSNPAGGSNEQPIQTYKNLASGSFGTYSSAVTKAQYQGTVGVYPGIVDAVTQAQRDINPTALEWMNVIRVAALTSSTWSVTQQQEFLKYMQTVTMYSPRFIWQNPIPVPRDVVVEVYCFNSATLSNMVAVCTKAINDLFAPRPGLLMTDFFGTDLTSACLKAGRGGISYVLVRNPTEPMIVTLPPSPALTAELVSGGGTLGSLVYAYGVSSINAVGEEGPPTNWVFPQVQSATPVYGIKLTWLPLNGIVSYKVYGRRAGAIGLLATISATDPLVFEDNGTIVPSGAPPNAIADIPIRYNSLASLSVKAFHAERQQRMDATPVRGRVQ